MLHNKVAINVSVAIQAKGTAKSNAELNFFSTIGVIQPYGKSKYISDVQKMEAKENKLQSDGT